jgi:hypothetical protein
MADDRNEPPGPVAHLLNDGYSLVPRLIGSGFPSILPAHKDWPPMRNDSEISCINKD